MTGVPPGPPETEVIRGSVDYKDVLRAAHELLAPDSYLEIGV